MVMEPIAMAPRAWWKVLPQANLDFNGKELTNVVLNAVTLKGVLPASGTVTMPAFSVAGNILPSAENAYSLGELGTTYYWLNVVAAKFAMAGAAGQFAYMVGDGNGALALYSKNTAGSAGVLRLALGISDITTATWNAITQSGLDITSGEVLKVAGVQVVGARVVDARADDVANSGDATTDGLIDALRDAMIAHGLIAAA